MHLNFDVELIKKIIKKNHKKLRKKIKQRQIPMKSILTSN